MQFVEAFGTGYQMPDDSHFPFPGYRLQAAQRPGNFEARTSHCQFHPKQECLDLVLLSFDQKERSQRFLRGTLRDRSAEATIDAKKMCGFGINRGPTSFFSGNNQRQQRTVKATA